MSTLGINILAIGWEPELRGILTVIIAVGTLMGSVYLILSTNVGARLGFLVSFAAFAGWMFIMGAVWWAYGIGLKGPEPSWASIPGRTVLQDTRALSESGAFAASVDVDDNLTFTQQALEVDEQAVTEGWEKLPESAPSFGQAGSAAAVFLEESDAFAAGEFKVVNVFDKGGERYPRLWDGKLDFLAFWHKPHYVLVEVAPLLEDRSEPGRAPAPARIDESRPHQYVYMIRDMGAKRQPAGFITGGSLLVFLLCCWMLHRRDRIVAANRAQLAIPAKA